MFALSYPRLAYLTSALLCSLSVSACHDTTEGPRPLSETPTEIDDDSDQPIRLSYVCGNRFVLVNSYSVPLSVTWRVPQTGEEGSATVAAADTTRHPSASEQLVETRSKGTLELYLSGRKVKSRANAAVPCAPAAGPSL